MPIERERETSKDTCLSEGIYSYLKKVWQRASTYTRMIPIKKVNQKSFRLVVSLLLLVIVHSSLALHIGLPEVINDSSVTEDKNIYKRNYRQGKILNFISSSAPKNRHDESRETDDFSNLFEEVLQSYARSNKEGKFFFGSLSQNFNPFSFVNWFINNVRENMIYRLCPRSDDQNSNSGSSNSNGNNVQGNKKFSLPINAGSSNQGQNVLPVVKPSGGNSPAVVGPPVTSNNPSVGGTSIGKPSNGNSPNGSPSGADPLAGNPSVGGPSAGTPSGVDSSGENPAIVDPSAGNPSVMGPSAGNPTIVDPSTGNPVGVDSSSGNPTGVNPSTGNSPDSSPTNGEGSHIGHPGSPGSNPLGTTNNCGTTNSKPSNSEGSNPIEESGIPSVGTTQVPSAATISTPDPCEGKSRN